MPDKIWGQIKKDPFGILGMHKSNNTLIIRILNHAAEKIYIVNNHTKEKYPCSKQENSLFTVELESDFFDYHINIQYPNGEWSGKDCYSFPPVISEFDLHLFNEGTHRTVWKILGSHPMIHEGIPGILFSVWAPNAKSVRIIGDFNYWDKERHFMRPRGLSGVWELFIPHLEEGQRYKYAIETSNNHILEKSDPYSNYFELRPNTGSITYNIEGYSWNDHEWMTTRTKCIDEPLSIYECHLSSWLRDHNNQTLSYEEICKLLAEYLKEHNFTHVELMPITEYPYDKSWGYQVTGYYASTSRYGTPKDFMYFIDTMHQYGIGVIIDWVPAHFPSDIHGLSKFDGTSLYEHESPELGWHPDWNTYIFNFGRNEVRQFLIGSALYWMENFHIDGLRVDAVASMLYLDYSRNEGEWIPNKFGGRENLDAIEFLQSLNTEIDRYFPTVMTIAEESTNFFGVTKSTEEGGLGFTYKWNMGWMNDTLNYFCIDPIFRSWHHNDITFSLIYAFSERYILPFSHDEVVHGKGTLLSRMPGTEWEKFANLRALFVYMWSHPGKKLLFSGQEFAPWDEWSEEYSIDWHLNGYALHAGVRNLIKDINEVYTDASALYAQDFDSSYFSWIDCDNNESGLLMWVRKDQFGHTVITILNLNTIVKINWKIGVPRLGIYKEVINSDAICYGGANIINKEPIYSEEIPWQGQPYSMNINIGPLSGIIFRVYP